MFNVTQAKPEDVFAQIEKDLNEAIPSPGNRIGK
jgi:argininosuccinate lyase